MAAKPINTADLRIKISKEGLVPGNGHISGFNAGASTMHFDNDNTVALAEYDLLYFQQVGGYPDWSNRFAMVESGSALAATTAGDLDIAVGLKYPEKNETWGGGTAEYQIYKDADFIELCATSIDFQPGSTNFIDVPTFCNRTQKIKSAVQDRGTITFSGYMDISTDVYKALAAGNKDKTHEHVIAITYGDTFAASAAKNFYALVGGGIIQSLDWDVPIDGAIAYTATIKVTKSISHIDYN